MSEITVNLRGPMFTKKVQGVVRDAIVIESLRTIGDRVTRPGRGLGRKNNTVTNRVTGLSLVSTSTLQDKSSRAQRDPHLPTFNPRTKGVAWTQKHVGGRYGRGIIPAMAPAVLRKTAQRIVADLGG